MMAANRTEYAHPSNGDGLIFDWRKPRQPHFTRLGMIALAAVIFVLPLSVVRLKMSRPPIQESRSASLMMLTPGHDPMQWLETARSVGPFPTRFDPAEWEPSQALINDAMDGIRDRSIPPYQPRFQGLPSDAPPPNVPLVAKGSRVLPDVTPPEFESIQAIHVKPKPVLYPLTTDASAMPEHHVPFDVEVSPETAYQSWRFLLQVSPDGTVLHAVALLGHNTPGRTDLIDWLQAHRFPAQQELNDRWVAVAVTFQNETTHGTDDP